MINGFMSMVKFKNQNLSPDLKIKYQEMTLVLVAVEKSIKSVAVSFNTIWNYNRLLTGF